MLHDTGDGASLMTGKFFTCNKGIYLLRVDLIFYLLKVKYPKDIYNRTYYFKSNL